MEDLLRHTASTRIAQTIVAPVHLSVPRMSRMPEEARLVAKRQNENLKRRIETLLIKAYEIWDDYGVDVAMVLKNNTQYYTYKSIDRPTWPPSMTEIEATYPLPKNLSPRDLKKRAAKRRSSTRPRVVGREE